MHYDWIVNEADSKCAWLITIAGVKYLNECPVQPKIPIYLLVGGCFGLLKLLSMLWKQVRSRRYERLDEIMDEDDGNGDVIMSKSSRFSEAVLSLFLFIWFIFGNYWVLGIYKPHFQLLLHEPSNWCDKTVYMFAFIQICICYGLMGLIAIIMCILGMCHRCTADKSWLQILRAESKSVCLIEMKSKWPLSCPVQSVVTAPWWSSCNNSLVLLCFSCIFWL